jgi:asparagine synthase (glutamine-hydrolysing)
MCGIAGILGLQSENSLPCLQKMVNAIDHRGPDANGMWIKEGAALGQTRLSIIDLSIEGNQPMEDESGRYVLVFNGEIYNFREIKSKIPDYPFKSHSDTEVILAAFIKWGRNCLQYFNGMFAIAIWDREKEELFIARDRLGIKPLYYYKKDNLFVFASEVRALLKTGLVPKSLNKAGVQDYLTYQTIHAPYSIIENVFQLMPGECGVFQNNKFEKSLYWDLMAQGNLNGEDWEYDKVKKQVKQLLLEAVDRRMISDVPIGAFLSGGIDSTAIVALMAEVSDQPIHTFAVVFGEKEFDESLYSNLAAKKFNTNHTSILLKPKDFLDELPAALKAMDVPSSDGVNTYTVSKATKNAGITVALSGLGGDELFVGYKIYNQWYQLNKRKLLWKIPLGIRKSIGKIAGNIIKDHRSERIEELLSKKDFNFESFYPILRKVMTSDDLKEIAYQYPLNKNYLEEQFLGLSELMDKKPIFTQSSIGDISSYTQNILLRDADQMSMASALEIRVPFFDHKLVEYVMKIPDTIKYPHYPKKLLVESLNPLLPNEIVHRKKMGFTFPWELWIKTELKDFCEKNLRTLGEKGIFRSDELMNYWNRFLKGDKKITWVKIWLLVVLANWLSENEI